MAISCKHESFPAGNNGTRRGIEIVREMTDGGLLTGPQAGTCGDQLFIVFTVGEYATVAERNNSSPLEKNWTTKQETCV